MDLTDILIRSWASRGDHYAIAILRRLASILNIQTSLTTLQDATASTHVDVASAGTLVHGAGVLTPDTKIVDNLLYLSYGQPTDEAFRIFKIDGAWVDGASIHVHWTKDTDLNVAGATCRWLINYKVFNGHSDLGSGLTATLDTGTLTYAAADTVGRTVYESADLPLTGLYPGCYITVRITKAVPGTGTPIAVPGLVSMDLIYRKYINKEVSEP